MNRQRHSHVPSRTGIHGGRRKILLILAAACFACALILGLGWWLHVGRRPAEPVTVCAGDFDLVVLNGFVLDGLGNAPVRADVGVHEGSIACVGSIKDAGAARVIDAAGLMVAPGFIDVHTHVERSLLEDEKPLHAPNFVGQGVTTLVTGNCGSSKLGVGGMLAQLERGGSQVNVATFVGHNSIRRSVMRNDNRPPTPAEMEKMRKFVAEAMKDGALGFSTGLAYVPGVYAREEEVVELARVAARGGGIYVTHIRDEGANGFDAVKEAIDIGLRAGLPVHISHFKATGPDQWGAASLRLGLVEAARARGEHVTVDQYPYDASSTSLDLLLPSWVLAEDSARVASRLRQPATRARVIDEMLAKLRMGRREDYSFARVVYCPSNLSLNGLTIPQVAALGAGGQGRQAASPDRLPSLERQVETILDLKARGGAQMIYFDMSEQDVITIMRRPYTMFGSDSSVREESTKAVPHPRGFGTFPRVLASYVRANQTLTLEEAIRRMTSLPADIFALPRRGRISPGYWADLVIFQEQLIADKATYDNPLLPPVGISHVIVNGQSVLEDGHLSKAAPGRAIRRGQGKHLGVNLTGL